jgi:hypothetical protein
MSISITFFLLCCSQLPQETVLNKIERLENHVQSISAQVRISFVYFYIYFM